MSCNFRFLHHILDYLLLFTNCKKERIMLSKETSTDSGHDTISLNNIEKSLIVLSAPSVKNKYYSSKFIDINDYMANFANLVIGKDEVVILADADTLSQFEGKVPSNILIEAVIDDIWIRDFSPVIPSK